MKFIELFAGIGGFRYGLEAINRKENGRSQEIKEIGKSEGYQESKRINAERGRSCKYDNRGGSRQESFTCVYANEWDKYAAAIYEKNFGERPDTRDITTVDVSYIPDHDLLVGGFPCQAFSIAGKRKGFDDTRGTLFFEIARILQAKRPRYLLLENVKGLLSHDGGRTFQIILQTLDELGYDLQWQVLNSKNFGVPQNRERVFIVGHLRGERRPEVFPIRAASQEFDKRLYETQVVGALSAGGHSGGHHSSMTLIREQFDVSGKGYASQPDRVYYTDGIIGCLPENRTASKIKIFQPIVGGSQKHQTIRSDGNSPTLTQAMGIGGGQVPILLNQIRRLTEIECERLQGFPDNWTEGVSPTQRYKCLGNAVTTNVITAIGERLINGL